MSILQFPSLHRYIDETCTPEEKQAFLDYKVKNDCLSGIKVKGDPAKIAQYFEKWFTDHSNGKPGYLSLAKKVYDYFMVMNNRLKYENHTSLQLV